MPTFFTDKVYHKYEFYHNFRGFTIAIATPVFVLIDIKLAFSLH